MCNELLYQRAQSYGSITKMCWHEFTVRKLEQTSSSVLFYAFTYTTINVEHSMNPVRWYHPKTDPNTMDNSF
jgi:hypothetical protein